MPSTLTLNSGAPRDAFAGLTGRGREDRPRPGGAALRGVGVRGGESVPREILLRRLNDPDHLVSAAGALAVEEHVAFLLHSREPDDLH